MSQSIAVQIKGQWKKRVLSTQVRVRERARLIRPSEIVMWSFWSQWKVSLHSSLGTSIVDHLSNWNLFMPDQGHLVNDWRNTLWSWAGTITSREPATTIKCKEPDVKHICKYQHLEGTGRKIRGQDYLQLHSLSEANLIYYETLFQTKQKPETKAKPK